jgi:hypothetical protein
VHPNLIAALADDHRRSCPCGAVTGQPRQPCRHCLARQTWRRHIGLHPRSAVRHPPGSLACLLAKAARS